MQTTFLFFLIKIVNKALIAYNNVNVIGMYFFGFRFLFILFDTLIDFLFHSKIQVRELANSFKQDIVAIFNITCQFFYMYIDPLLLEFRALTFNLAI